MARPAAPAIVDPIGMGKSARDGVNVALGAPAAQCKSGSRVVPNPVVLPGEKLTLEQHRSTNKKCMSQRESRIGDSWSTWMESDAPLSEVKNMPLAARTRAADDAGTAIERQLNGPLTALLLYMGEIKQYSDQLSLSASNRIYLQQVVDNALKQTERVCALIKQLEAARGEIQAAPDHAVGWQSSAGGKGEIDAPQINFLSAPGQKPLTKREREVLNLISEGYSNKQGALQMQISPRTFESHRAVAMRKLGARNTADLVRTALGHPGAI